MKEKTILIITSSVDKTIDYMMNRFPKQSFLRLNIDQLEHYNLSISLNNGTLDISYNDGTIFIENLFEKIYAIYYRKIFLPNLGAFDEKYHSFMQKEIYGFIVGLVDSFAGKVLTKPHILRRTENKVFQLVLAKKLNIPMPTSIIGNDAIFVETKIQNTPWIAKPLASGKITAETIIQTSLVDKQIRNISLSPTYFQQYIPKDYELRITVIKNKFYCVKIKAKNQIDWRKDEDANIYEQIEIPSEIQEECQRFLEYCELDFGCFDYIINKKQHYFLECNPNGQWGWLEMKLKLNISEEIMRYLYA